MMDQPELGKKICESRNRKGMTQKDLSELCHIDVRTIQRIESGEVFPRASTIRLIAEALDLELNEFNSNDPHGSVNQESFRGILLATMLIGLIHLVNWFFNAPLFPTFKMFNPYNWIYSIVDVVTTVFFYYGFYVIAGYFKNSLLKFASSFFMIGGPLYFISTTINDVLSILILSILGINCIFFGIGLMKTKSSLLTLYKSTGILQLLIAPFFILPIGVLNIVGCWMNIPLYILMLCIMFLEYRKLRQVTVKNYNQA